MAGNENFRLLVEAFRWGSRPVPYEVAICAPLLRWIGYTGESPVYVARQHRRLATVNRAGRTNYPRKAASSWG